MFNLCGVGATSGKSKRNQSISLIALALPVLIFAVASWGQTTVGTGSINGTVSDPAGAVVSGARVTITSTETGQSLRLNASPSGAYTSGPLAPGTYKVQ